VAEKPFVVQFSDVPISSVPEDRELERRPFRGHELLAGALSSATVTLSWIDVRAGRQVTPQHQTKPGLLIILSGSAALTGSTTRPVEQGDVITLPAGHEYGFSALGAGGLQALHVAFRDQDEQSEREVTLDDLLARNEARANATLKTPYFQMLGDGTMSSAVARGRFRQCARVFSDVFQTLLFTRQAMCRDGEYEAAFNAHLLEEVGHNEMLKVPYDARIFADPTLLATLSWFCRQMLIVDNVGKTVVNLVLETAGYHFHSLAKPVFEQDEGRPYFDAHAEGDEIHKDMGLELLEKQHPLTYRRLLELLDDSYDMFEAVTQRIFELVTLANEP
jgi:mannose-6-phosphate isomerase-like protein (cupin superfamily)